METSVLSTPQPSPERIRSYWLRNLLLITLLALLLGAVALAGTSAQVRILGQNDLNGALDIIGEINAWRLEAGLSPVRVNETLMDLALYQAEYLHSLRSIPDGNAIHRGRNGEGIQTRARYSQFDWPRYARSDQIAVAEIAAVYTLERAIDFWRSSPPHFRTVTNPAYREVGAAAIPRQFNTLYVVVFGARPNVLPALLHPETNQLYLTREEYKPAVHNNGIINPTGVRFFDADGRPLQNDWTPWNKVINMPEDLSESVYILYTDGDIQTLSSVNLERDIIVLPGHHPPVELFSFVPTATPGPTSTPVPPTATPEPRPVLTLIYNETTLTIINTAGRALNLFPFTLNSGNSSVPLSWWRDVSNFPMAEFPDRHCLQVSVVGVSRPFVPSECRIARAQRSQQFPVRHFWINDFEVRSGGQRLATCEAAAGRCEVYLP